MRKSSRGTKNKPKKIGRPATGKGTQIGMRWHEPLLSMIEKWAARQDDKPERSEAIRRLLERALATEPQTEGDTIMAKKQTSRSKPPAAAGRKPYPGSPAKGTKPMPQRKPK